MAKRRSRVDQALAWALLARLGRVPRVDGNGQAVAGGSVAGGSVAGGNGGHSAGPRARPADPDSSCPSDLGYLKSTDLVAFAAAAEPRAIAVAVALLRDEGQPQPLTAVLAEVAFELDISTETARRYVIKHSARRAELRIDEKGVWLR